MEIYFEDGQAVSEEIRKTMERAACRCLETEGVDGQRAELSVTFVDPDVYKRQKINRGRGFG